MTCEHLSIARERMPDGYIHYEKITCSSCGKFMGWGKNPATLERERQNEQKIASLRNGTLSFWEQKFVNSIVGKHLSPKQQQKLNEIWGRTR